MNMPEDICMVCVYAQVYVGVFVYACMCKYFLCEYVFMCLCMFLYLGSFEVCSRSDLVFFIGTRRRFLGYLESLWSRLFWGML